MPRRNTPKYQLYTIIDLHRNQATDEERQAWETWYKGARLHDRKFGIFPMEENYVKPLYGFSSSEERIKFIAALIVVSLDLSDLVEDLALHGK